LTSSQLSPALRHWPMVGDGCNVTCSVTSGNPGCYVCNLYSLTTNQAAILALFR